MTFRLAAAALALALALSACAYVDLDGPQPDAATNWRSVATGEDRERLREWRTAWTDALARARAAGHSAAIAGEGALLQPDDALPLGSVFEGTYRCRTIKIGAQSKGLLDYVAYPAFECRISAEGGILRFTRLGGSQRPVGRLFPDSPRRMVFLGTLQLSDETGSFAYGQDRERDMAGILERIGDQRWRLVFPSPHFESRLDVIELIPAR